jgi:purine-binding chemotaxis protein CheW
MADEGNVAGEVQLVVFQLGTEEFGVDIKQVKEIIKVTEITRIPNSPSFVEGVINLRGQITTIMDLRKRLDLAVSEQTENTRIIIVELEKNTIGMIVDSVAEVLRLPRSEIEPTPSISTEVDTEYIMGVGKLSAEDRDRLLILLDLTKVLSQEEAAQIEEVGN